MAEPLGPLAWYALHVRGNHEKRVTAALFSRAVDVFLPVYMVRSCWSDRMKVLSRPLFPGYVFAHLDLESDRSVLAVEAVYGIAPNHAKPVEIATEDIDAIRLACASGRVMRQACPEPGERCRVTDGALAGLEGVVIHSHSGGRRLVICIEILGRGVSVALESEAVRACR